MTAEVLWRTGNFIEINYINKNVITVVIFETGLIFDVVGTLWLVEQPSLHQFSSLPEADFFYVHDTFYNVQHCVV